MSLTQPPVFSQGSAFDPLGIDDGTPYPSRAGDTTAPSKPVVSAVVRNFHEIELTFSAPADNVGVTSRVLFRDGTKIAVFLLGETAYRDSQLSPGVSYSYTLIDTDHIGNDSPESDSVSATTASLPIRINCGGASDWTDSQGRVFYADTGFAMPSVGDPAATARAILGTVEDELYQSQRNVPASPGGTLKYSIPLTGGSYLIRLHWAEVDLAAGPQTREMNVNFDGITLESAVDPFVNAGGVDTALVKEYSVTADGQADLELVATAGRPFLSAIEIGIPPPAPANLAASNIGETSFDLTCDAVVGAVAYHWHINNSFYQTTLSPSLSVGDRTIDTAYSCQVRARNSAGFDGPFSSTLQVMTVGHIAPDAPTNLAVTATTATSLTVSCDSVAGAVSYDWYLDGSLHSSSASSAATLTGLTPGTQYSLSAKAIDAIGPPSGESQFSFAILASTDASNLTAPLNLVASSITQSGFTLSCDTVAGATNYEWYIDDVLYTTTASPSAAVTGRSADTAYNTKVRAIDSVPTQGPFSVVLPVTTAALTLPAQPVNLVASNITQGSFDLTCDAVPGAVSYSWLVDGSFRTSTVSPTALIVGLVAGETVTCTVQAEGAGSVFGPFSDPLVVEVLFAQPSNLRSLNVQATSFDLACDFLAGAALYHWWINGVQVASTTSPFASISSLTHNTVYACEVFVESASGVLGPAALITVLTVYQPSRVQLPLLRSHGYIHPASSLDLATGLDRTVTFIAERPAVGLELTDITQADQVRIA